jgi:hypothetical protein
MACGPRVVGQRGFVAITQPACPVVHSKAYLSSLFAVIHPTRWTTRHDGPSDTMDSRGTPGSLSGRLVPTDGRLLPDFEPHRYSLSPVLRAQRMWPGLKVGCRPPRKHLRPSITLRTPLSAAGRLLTASRMQRKPPFVLMEDEARRSTRDPSALGPVRNRSQAFASVESRSKIGSRQK